MTVDPTYAPAFSHAAWWHSYRIGQGWSKDIAMDASEAERLSATAIELNRNDSLALAVYGHHKSYLLKDFDAALQYFHDAIDACPNSAVAWTLKGATCCFIGDGRRAVLCAETGLRLSPRDNHVFFAEHILAQSYYVNNNFDEAVRWARRAHEHNSYLTSNLRTLAASLVATGCIDEARAVGRHHQKVAPTFHLLEWVARTPMIETIKHRRLERLRLAGLPD
jgi:tetratricopeptide (TPR) repeat protein